MIPSSSIQIQIYWSNHKKSKSKRTSLHSMVDDDIIIPMVELQPTNDNDNNNNNISPTSHSLRTWLRTTIFLGIDPSPDILAIATIYFVQGALGLARLAQTFLLKDELQLGPAELSALTGLFVLPWTIKPIYGFLSDGFPLLGYKRRSYLILAGLVGCFSYTALGHDFWGLFDDTSTMIQATVVSLMISSASIAFSDVVADGIVVQKTRDCSSEDPSMAGALQSLCWGSAALGGLLSAYYSGSLLQVMKPQQVFQITAILPLLVACIAVLIDEQPTNNKTYDDDGKAAAAAAGVTTSDINVATTTTTTNGSTTTTVGETVAVVQDPDDGLQGQIQALKEAFLLPSIWKPTLFLFLWQSTPTSDGAFLFFMTDELGFGPEFLGRVRLVTALAGLVGVGVYNTFLKNVPIKDILFWSSLASFPLGMSTLLLITHANRDLGIPDAAFVFGDDVALAILGQVAFMPTLVLAARLCPPGVEAVLFATLMSIFNAAGTVGTEIGAVLTKWLGVTGSNFDNLGLLTILCNVSSLYPLLFIGWLDEVGAAAAVSSEEEGKEQELLVVQASELQVSLSSKTGKDE
jgi:folate/biopterin transporter